MFNLQVYVEVAQFVAAATIQAYVHNYCTFQLTIANGTVM